MPSLPDPSMTARVLSTLLPLALLLGPGTALALYKVVGADGKVTYTDRPPSDRPSQTLRSSGSLSDTGALPFELRQVTGKFPVTLYGGRDCAPCERGRALLRERGVPFAEKTVESNEDIQTLRRLEGTDQLPVLRVGAQRIKGFSSQEWQSYLDAAGYPKESALPRNYVWPSPTSLVQQAPPPASQQPAATRAPVAPATANGSVQPDTNPPGFRF